MNETYNKQTKILFLNAASTIGMGSNGQNSVLNLFVDMLHIKLKGLKGTITFKQTFCGVGEGFYIPVGDSYNTI